MQIYTHIHIIIYMDAYMKGLLLRIPKSDVLTICRVGSYSGLCQIARATGPAHLREAVQNGFVSYGSVERKNT